MRMSTRADRIYEIINSNGGRMHIREIMQELVKLDEEKNMRLTAEAVGSTIRMDNKTRSSHGTAPRFITCSDGSEIRGYFSITKENKASKNKSQILAKPQLEVPALIEEINKKIKAELRENIKRLSWEEFQQAFLESLLKALGFNVISLSKLTRDGGKDAICVYKRGLIKSSALVSSKHWKANKVGIGEVQRVRGIKGEYDTAIIITSSSFTQMAIEEAENAPRHRSVVLIDINQVVDICFENGVGVNTVEIPTLYSVDNQYFIGISK
jgi:HJR/Mrr/RecB family endonuclease